MCVNIYTHTYVYIDTLVCVYIHTHLIVVNKFLKQCEKTPK